MKKKPVKKSKRSPVKRKSTSLNSVKNTKLVHKYEFMCNDSGHLCGKLEDCSDGYEYPYQQCSKDWEAVTCAACLRLKK